MEGEGISYRCGALSAKKDAAKCGGPSTSNQQSGMSPCRHMPGHWSLRLTRQLKLGFATVHANWFSAVADSEILESELSLSVVERTTAAKAGQLFVARWWRFNADNSVLRIAGLAPKNKGREI